MTGDYLEHRARDGERWDALAWRYYGDPTQYGRIAEANPDLNLSATLPAGERVLIPVLTVAEAGATAQESDLPPWKR
jgi:phage tail protein X